MQYIFKQSQTTHFYQGVNAIAQDGSLSDRAARILNYAISLPEDWRIIPRQLMKHFGWGRDATYKALKELRKRGYAVLVRCRRAATWYIFNTPQTPETLATFTASNQPKPTPDEASKNPDFKNSCQTDALQSNKDLQNTEKTTTAVEPVQIHQEQLPVEKPSVVVSCDEVANDHPISTSMKAIDDIQGIEPQYQPAAKRALSRLTPEQMEMVLVAFTLQCSKTAISNKAGYLIALVQSALNGTFSPVQPSGAAPMPSLSERIAIEKKRQQEQQARGKMSNAEYAEWLQRTYGGKAVEGGKSDGRISLKRALGWA